MSRARRYLALVVAASTSGPGLSLGLMTWVVAVFLAVVADTSGFQPGWGDPLNYALNATTFIGPIAAGSAAHQVAALGRARLLDLGRTSPLGPGAQARLVIVSTTGWTAAALLSIHLILLLTSDGSGAKTPAMLLLPAASVGIVVLCATVGALCGLIWRSVATAPVVTLVSFAWMYALVFVDGKLSRLVPIYPEVFYNDAIEPNPLLVGAQVGCLAGLSVLALGATWRGGVRAVSALVGSLVFLASAAAWHHAGPEATQVRQPPERLPCVTQGSVQLCYWPESAEQAHEAVRALTEGYDRLSTYADLPTRFAQRGLTDRVPGSREFLMPRRENADYAYRAVLALAPPLTCDVEGPAEAHRQLVNLYTALTDAGPVSEDTGPVLEKPVGELRAWIAHQEATIEGCPTP